MRWVMVLLAFLALPAWAQTYPDYERTTITDSADLLTDAQETALDQRLARLRQDTGIEFAVLTLPSQTPFAPDQSLESFATGLFNHWGIGDATRNDGILVLILRDDRAMRIELGAGFGRDWDRVSADVVNRSFLPAFTNEDYAGGIEKGVEDVISSIAIPFSEGSDAPRKSVGIEDLFVPIAFLGAVLIMARNRIADWATRFRRCPNCGRRTLRRSRKTLRKATKSNGGEGEINTRCSNCSYDHHRIFQTPRVTRSSSSSFGGGRSGGGGASGRW